MRIGIVCHAGFGGSGVIATELGLALAARGHEAHFFSPAPPVRFHAEPRVTFHPVPNPTHPLFPGGEYAIALASKLVEVTARERLELLHLHYAIPHAVSAQLARRLLGRSAPRLVTTLHGTDVLTFGADPAFAPVLRAAVAESDAITVPSKFLRDETTRIFRVDSEVVSNFVNVIPSPETGEGGRAAKSKSRSCEAAEASEAAQRARRDEPAIRPGEGERPNPAVTPSYGFRTQLYVSTIDALRSTTSKSSGVIALNECESIPSDAHFAVESRSSLKVSAMLPPSLSSMP